MIRELNVRGVKWIDGVDLDKASIYNCVKNFDFHELDLEACMEENQTARIDVYEDYLFLILHFPKYNLTTRSYELNEFNIFIGKDFLITFRNFPGIHIDRIFDRYSKLDIDEDFDLKVSSGFILYEIIQAMLEKMFKATYNVKKDIRLIEKKVFDHASSILVKEIMEKKRNIIVLRNMFTPQIQVFKNIELQINDFFKSTMEVYFEDLEDKLSHIINNIKLLDEHISSLEDAFKTIIDIRTNSIIKILTIFSAFILPLTLVTSFYGMNITLPHQNNSDFVYFLIILSVLIMGVIFLYFRKNGKL